MKFQHKAGPAVEAAPPSRGLIPAAMAAAASAARSPKAATPEPAAAPAAAAAAAAPAPAPAPAAAPVITPPSPAADVPAPRSARAAAFEGSVSWVDGIQPCRLGLMAAPRGGAVLIEEVAAWRAARVATVVSLLEPTEAERLGLADESVLCARQGINFIQFPIEDRSIPRSRKAVAALVTDLRWQLMQGRAVVVHCRVGIGRTGVLAGCLLHALRVPADDIFHLLSRSRGMAMPDTAAQADWVAQYVRAYPNR